MAIRSDGKASRFTWIYCNYSIDKCVYTCIHRVLNTMRFVKDACLLSVLSGTSYINCIFYWIQTLKKCDQWHIPLQEMWPVTYSSKRNVTSDTFLYKKCDQWHIPLKEMWPVTHSSTRNVTSDTFLYVLPKINCFITHFIN